MNVVCIVNMCIELKTTEKFIKKKREEEEEEEENRKKTGARPLARRSRHSDDSPERSRTRPSLSHVSAREREGARVRVCGFVCADHGGDENKSEEIITTVFSINIRPCTIGLKGEKRSFFF